jgi:hypothetical protein
MTHLETLQAAQPVEETPAAATPNSGSAIESMPVETEAGPEVSLCTTCAEPAANACRRCRTSICEVHSYHEKSSILYYCRACADALVGVCDVCEALHARPCRECGMKVCQEHQKRVIERWGWGGAPGQGGVTSWFPVMRTYCQEHGHGRVDVPKPTLSIFKGYDASSPEW